MQSEFFTRLCKPVQNLILDVEKRTGIEICVIPHVKQNAGGANGQGSLAINITPHRIHLFVPTNGYFPEGAVCHEILHVKRFHLEGVPKLALADTEEWDSHFADALCSLDNAIEHLAIVPIELDAHPERQEHWERVMSGVCSSLPFVPEGEKCLAVCMHWTFLRHVLPNSSSVEALKEFAQQDHLFDIADRFAVQLIERLACKEDLVKYLFDSFPEIPRKRAALEYLRSGTGHFQKAIP